MEQPGTNESPQNTHKSQAAPEPQLEHSPIPIGDFVARPDFPDCTRGVFVNIGGSTGIVVDIVGNSLKVRSEETTMSFNCHVLKRLYGPREEQKPIVSSPIASRAETAGIERKRKTPSEEPEPEAPKRNIITEPNFSGEPKSIQEYTGRADFPQCTFGEYVDIGGYKGVIVEIVKGSLKVRSPEEVIRSYNSQVLRKLYPPGK